MRKDTHPVPKARAWSRVLVPALDRPYSGRGLETACRLAQSTGAEVLLACFIEVPRTLALDADLPEQEEIASDILATAEAAARTYKLKAATHVQRVRDPREGILRFAQQREVDLLVLGARPDEERGLPRELTRELFLSSPCEVVMDFIANEK